ncbi:hypothetical protein BIV57_07895 [Mangrovactinospora gilvigrisea]|uniref:WXG100 family type VII secretion target n=1 Tax=Mangrovactinospora gilvigrisea TaxID=1428644 RepID=A0A1J7C920_9ACTN|nr:WXG100 family type VII secretion target [Mangrovactinospora gilvigrisea]OIV38028.1 hypothetical protein BIV57_07895 [Mangrovactinospora gilvigrisea]
MATVKVTPQAHADAKKMLTIINHDLGSAMSTLKTTGDRLSQKDHWEGPKADQFRGQVWPDATSQLKKMQDALGKLQHEVTQILNNIQQAGS